MCPKKIKTTTTTTKHNEMFQCISGSHFDPNSLVLVFIHIAEFNTILNIILRIINRSFIDFEKISMGHRCISL